ncbi:penicillin-binding protein [Sphingomonas sp. Leaf412]|uniref:transglycosylase domain-containing protein n=1 Tax=Sphingomonas sp. Leaf412 TaxID=1736370 RepID=UPI0006F73397|nr:transglycosylase domain-containing protein [Sphingomonas sp. Leaf412]KQT34763.1 penicillin-binding protein [Sphingomonas sp. Leaf412]
MNPPYDSGRVRYNHGPGQPAGQPPAPPSGPLPSFDPWTGAAPEPPRFDAPPGGGEPPRRPRNIGKWIVRGLAALLVLFFALVAWLAITAPLSQSLKPPTPPSITLTDNAGKPIARRGAVIGAPVDAATLPPHVREAFLAIEDRRFYSHWGIDPRGIARAAWANVGSGGVRQGGSTITQQLAKNAFLDSDRTAARKIREVMIAFWLEAWLTKDEILSRYLSNVYFGDNVYGIRAAAKHYFGRTPERMNVGQAAMLAGLVKAPSRLAPTGNLKGARARQAVVVAAMVDAGFLTKREADAVQPQRVLPAVAKTVPSGTYFADWVLPEARDQAGEIQDEATVRTTLDAELQATAERIVRQAGLRKAQAAIVAMKTNGEVVAMVGGRDYKASPFNRAVQAKRQPGSTFKLFVYLAAMRAGMNPASTVDDTPVEIAGWKPKNDDGRYLGEISLARAFARSSNVAAARLTQQVGVRNVVRAARDLGITTPIANEATIGLGTSEVSLLELTGAYAAIANGSYPVKPRGLTAQQKGNAWFQSLTGGQTRMSEEVRTNMLSLLNSSIRGTGREANLPMMAYGKTGTSQSGRDAWFIGFAGELVVGVWVGNDDNSPNPGLHGGGIPAQMWRQFMASALDIRDPEPEPALIEEGGDQDAGNATLEFGLPDGVLDRAGVPVDRINEQLEGLGVDARMNPDGSVEVGPSRRAPPRDRRDERRPEEEPPGPDEF